MNLGRTGGRVRLRRAVIEALERRKLLSVAPGSTPFHGVAFNEGQRIEAEDFDLGGEGVAYHDTTATNLGDSNYRQGEGVDVQSGGTGLVVGSTAPGEWLNYTINVPETASYTIQARVALPSRGARFHYIFDGQIVSPTGVIPQTPGWSNFQTLTSGRTNLTAGVHVMTVSLDSNAYTLRSIGNFDWFRVTEAAGPASFNWTSAAVAPARRFEGYGRMVNGRLYTFGGYTAVSPFGVSNTVTVYDPSSNRWTYLGAMPAAETHAGVAVDDSTGSIYFVGGLRGSYPGDATSDVYRYDTTTNKWTQLVSLPKAMAAGTADIVNGQLHYIGGIDADSRDSDYGTHFVISLADVNSRNPSAQWSTAADMPTPRDHFSSAVVGGKIYVMGGEIGHDALHDQQVETDVYDPAADTWKRLADMPIPKSHDESGTFVDNGKIILAGGQVDDFLSTNTVVEYDPAADRWYTLAPLPNTLAGTVVQKSGSKLVVAGGYDGVSGVATMQAFVGTWNSGGSDSGTGGGPPIINPPPPPPPIINPPPPPPPVLNPPPSTSAFHGTPFTVGQTIQAEDFDKGGEGVAYHDNDAVNHGGAAYRKGEGVDVEAGGSNGYCVDYVGAGEWLTYTVNIAQAGNYRVQAAAANTQAGGSFHVEFGGLNKTGAIAVPATGGWSRLATVTSNAFSLSAGTIVMRVYFDKAAANMAVGNFDWFKIVPA